MVCLSLIGIPCLICPWLVFHLIKVYTSFLFGVWILLFCVEGCWFFCYFCRKNFKHIEKILSANGSSTMIIFVDKECWRNLGFYNMLFDNSQ